MAFRDREQALVAERDQLRGRLDEREEELAQARDALREARVGPMGRPTVPEEKRHTKLIAGVLAVVMLAVAAWFAFRSAPAASEPVDQPPLPQLQTASFDGVVLASEGVPAVGARCVLSVVLGPFPHYGSIRCGDWSIPRIEAYEATCVVHGDVHSCTGERGVLRYDRRQGDGQLVVCADADASCVGIAVDGMRDRPSLTLDADSEPRDPAGPVVLGAIRSLSSYGIRSCAVDEHGAAACWSSLGGGLSELPAGLGVVAEVSLGSQHACAIDERGRVGCWGVDEMGQASPPLSLAPSRHVAAGGDHSCAVDRDGTVACWGDNSRGQTDVPAGLTGVSALAAGFVHTCAIDGRSELVCWGDSGNGQLSVPPRLGPVRSFDTSSFQTCAVDVEHHVTCWGGLFDRASVPPRNLPLAERVVVGDAHACIVDEQGLVVCWGEQAVVPEDLGPVTLIAANSAQTCAVVRDGQVRCWGRQPLLANRVPVRVEAREPPVP